MQNEIIDIDFNLLEQLSESNPPAFFEQYEAICLDSQSASQSTELNYLKARAFITLGNTTDAEAILLDLLSLAINVVDYQLIVKCNLALSRCCSHSEESYKEKPFLDVAYEAAKNSKNDKQIIECLMLLGSFHQSKSEFVKALEYFFLAEKHSISVGNQVLLVKSLLAIGTNYYYTLKNTKSMEYLKRAMEICHKLDEPNLELIIINNLSSIYLLLLRFEEAETVLLRGLALSEEKDLALNKVKVLFNLGALAMRQDKHAEAIIQFDACREYGTAIGFQDPKYLFDLYSNLGGCHRYAGNPETALDYVEQAEQIAQSLDNKLMIREMELNKANLLLSMGRLEEAKTKLKSAKAYFAKNKIYDKLAIAQTNLADYYAAKSDYPRALSTLKELNAIYSEYVIFIMQEKTADIDKQVSVALNNQTISKPSEMNYAKCRDTVFIPDFIGLSQEHKRVVEAALIAAKHPNANVFITGESGTGKEIVANLIHTHSIRKDFPFIPVNVSAISPGLVESEFFGHKKGAFTSAIIDHVGFFQQADRGTLFMDEIGDMAIELQAKLLRVLETKQLVPVGSTRGVKTDFRVLSSTNRNIHEMMESNLFRLDLFYRLNTIEIHLEPLRKRPGDIEALIDYFVERFANEEHRVKPIIEPGFIRTISKYAFPGNVRELKNLIERLFILSSADRWDEGILSLLPLKISSKIGLKESLSISNKLNEKDVIIDALLQTAGSQKEASKLLNTSESTLCRKIAKYHLEVYTKKGK